MSVKATLKYLPRVSPEQTRALRTRPAGRAQMKCAEYVRKLENSALTRDAGESADLRDYKAVLTQNKARLRIVNSVIQAELPQFPSVTANGGPVHIPGDIKLHFEV